MEHVSANVHFDTGDRFTATELENPRGVVTLRVGLAVGATLFFENTEEAVRVLLDALAQLNAIEDGRRETECERFGDLGGYCPGDDMPPCPPCKVAAELANGA